MSEPQSYAPPPNARIEVLTFDDGARALSVGLRGVEGVRAVDASSLAAFHGARIRHEQVSTAKDGAGGINVGVLAATTALGMPVVTSKSTKDVTVSTEHLQHALALRISGVGEVWYLLAQSFNFRKALGPDAGYSSELNLRAFLKRLAAFAPAATKNAYVSAMIDRKDLPPPVDSLIDFLRIASK